MKILQTFNNLDYELTDEQAEAIMQASTEGKQNGIWVSRDYIAFSAIKGITSAPERKPAGPALPPGMDRGYGGVINLAARRLSHLKALARGMATAVENLGGPQKAPKAASLLTTVLKRIESIENPRSAEVPPTIPPPLEDLAEPEIVMAGAIPQDPDLNIEVPF